MTPGRRLALPLALLTAACVPERGDRSDVASAGFPAGFAERVDSIARAARANGPLAGLSIAVARDGEPVFVGTWGVADVTTGAEVDRSTRYELASVTELYTGVTAALLAHEGALDLDASLETLVPELAGIGHAGDIRVRHLLTQTSGLEDFEPAAVDAWVGGGEATTVDQALAAARARPGFAPGASWAHSSTGIRLVGEAIGHLAGVSWGRVVEERVTRPLGLAHTGPCRPVGEDAGRARIHEVADEGFEISPFDGRTGLGAERGMCATVEDLVRLPAALASGGAVPTPALERALEPTTLTAGPTVDYGLGIRRGDVAGRPLWGQMGGMGTYWAVLAHFPGGGLTVAVLQNTEGAAEDALTVAGAVVRAALGLGRPALEPAEIGDLERFAGRYDDEGGGFDIALVGDSLVRIRGARHALIPLGPREFGWRLFPMDRFRFHEAGAEVVGVSEYYNGLFGAYFPRLHPLEPVPPAGDPEPSGRSTTQ